MGLFGKKNDDGEDGNRLALFGSRSKSKSPGPAANPYAQGAASNNPYAQAKAKAYGGAGDHGSDPNQGPGGYGNDRYAANAMNESPYGAAPTGPPGGGRYGDNKFGAPSGYGGDRYGNAGGPAGGASRGPGGYGGMGGSAYGQQDDDNRDALFGGAKERMQQPQQQTGGAPPPPYGSGGPAPSGGYGGYGGQAGGYGGGEAYQERQLTAEEEEEEEVKATKDQMRFLKQSDVASTRNALRVAAQAEESGRDTLARLGAQGEHIHATEKALDLSHNQIRTADDKTRELKKLNKSMFAVHVGNPLTSASRRRDRDQAIVDRHLEERGEREATRMAAYQADQRMQQNFKDMGGSGGAGGGPKGRNLAERSKYQFEADSEDEQMEDEIDGNLDALSGAAGRLNALARATGKEVDLQNQHLDRIAEKSDRVDLGIATGRAKLDRIH